MPAADQYALWSADIQPPAVRLVAFQRWLAITLSERLVWPGEADKARRQIGQVSAFVQAAVADLGRHGFLFAPPALAAYLQAQLDHVAAYQRAGKVGDLYAYLRTTWDGWVGRQAEALAKQAREQRALRSQLPDRRALTIPEIVLRDLEARDQAIRDKRLFRAQVQRARKPRCTDSAAPMLPGFSRRDSLSNH